MLILFFGEKKENYFGVVLGGVWCVCGVPNILLAFFVCVSTSDYLKKESKIKLIE